MRQPKDDISGKTFGRLTAINADGRVPGGYFAWLCVCSCGSRVRVAARRLISGNTKSCGCLKRDSISQIGRETCTTHGMRRTPEYKAWQNAKGRCRNTSDRAYADYGGRGITLSEKWDTFEAFFADMGPRPSPDHSLDRIDNEGNYEPGNCRWATRKQQTRNRRGNLVVEAFGKRAALSEFVPSNSNEFHRAWKRIRKGWDAERAITAPSRRAA